MTDAEARLLAELRLLAGGRLRVDYAILCTAFGKVFPAMTGIEQRKRLHALLTALAAAKEVLLPAGKAHYDRIADPPMPRWIQLSRGEKVSARPAFDPAVFPWVPELRFAAEIRSLQQLDVLRRVQEFLASGGASRCMVPVKERSVELFGNEKTLDDLRSSALFRSGRLSLELLRCFQVSPPLVWEKGPSQEPRPVIVIENHSTWHSFARWNREHGAWSAVCYGSGDCFESSAPSLAEVVTQVPWDGGLLYFGDLDPKGLEIPLRAGEALSRSSQCRILPARRLYEAMIAASGNAPLPLLGRLPLSDAAVEWLGHGLAERVRFCFDRGMRLPQELIGYEYLAATGGGCRGIG